MGVDHAPHRLRARIRNAPLADAPVVVRDVLHEPVDRVVGVRAFVRRFGGLRLRQDRPHHDELALGSKLPAHVLIHEDELLCRKRRRGTERRAVRVGPVRRRSVRRPMQHERVRCRRILWRIDDGEQLHTVPHRHHVLAFYIGRANLLRGRRLLREGRVQRNRDQDAGDDDGASLHWRPHDRQDDTPQG